MKPVFTRKDCSGLAAALEGCKAGRVFIVCDAAVRSFVDTEVLPQVDAPVYELVTSEAGKSLATVEGICRWLMENGADRKSFLLAVGGGITTDMAGFAASIYMRGIRFAYVPTTLLAMVDAAIGGKTGVNFLGYKNMLGTFCEPEFTYEATSALTTLSRRDILGGASEMIKSFIIEDRDDNYRKAVSVLSAMKGDADIEALTPLIEAAAAVKCGIVTRDFREGGERRKLNLGHTYAHAIEHMAQEHGCDISHGEAVSMGMVLAARLSERKGLAPKGLAAEIEKDLRSCALTVDCPFDEAELVSAMGKDKKAENGEVNFVLIRGIGDVTVEKYDLHSIAE